MKSQEDNVSGLLFHKPVENNVWTRSLSSYINACRRSFNYKVSKIVAPVLLGLFTSNTRHMHCQLFETEMHTLYLMYFVHSVPYQSVSKTLGWSSKSHLNFWTYMLSTPSIVQRSFRDNEETAVAQM